MKITKLSLLKLFAVLGVPALIIFLIFQTKSDGQHNISTSAKPLQKSEIGLLSIATHIVQPQYPPLSLAARISGSVKVEITIDENGKVVSARALSGHALLKDTAENAARQWTFEPTVINSKPIKVTGIITLDFDPDTYQRNSETEKETPEPALTPEAREKLERTEKAANHFVQRWQETLDLNVLFDEMYVSSPKVRRRNLKLFYGVYSFISASGYDTGSQPKGIPKKVDEALMRDGFMAFWNMYYLSEEYRLAFDKSPAANLRTPPDLEKAMEELRKVRLNKNYIIRKEVEEFIKKANNISSLYRKYLTGDVFKSDLYKANLKKCRKGGDGERRSFRIASGFAEYGIGEEVEVYNYMQCIFHFYFLEEEGQLKVITLGFEL